MKPSVMRTMCHAAIEVGKTLGQWFEDAIEEKPEREGRENILFEQTLDLKPTWQYILVYLTTVIRLWV